MAATSGARLINEEAIATLKEKLLPLAMLITPNIPEAQILSEMQIRHEEDMVKAAKHIQQRYSCNVLIKGGHQINDANDYLQTADYGQWFYGKHIDNPNTHGTGCTLSSAIACALAQGMDLADAVNAGKAYLTGALAAGLNMGKGSGPVNHMWQY